MTEADDLLRTDRFRLRSWRDGDAADVAEACQDSDIRRSINHRAATYTLEDGRAFIRSAQARQRSGQMIAFAVAVPGSDRVIGAMTLHTPSEQHWYVGYWMSSRWRRQGITAEALGRATEWAFRAHPSLVRISCFARPDNIGSHRVAEGAGYRREGLLRRWLESEGTPKDVVMFSFVRDDREEDREPGTRSP